MTKSSLGGPRVPTRWPKGALWMSKWASGGHFGLKMKPLGCLLAANGLELEPCGVTQEPLWRQKSISRWLLGAPWEHIKPIVHDLVDFRSNMYRFWMIFGSILSTFFAQIVIAKTNLKNQIANRNGTENHTAFEQDSHGTSMRPR